jgi:uracil phosphoribosyltransferase
MSAPVTIVQHPLLQIRLSALREVSTPNATFRILLRQAGQLLATAVAETLATEPITVETPLESTPGVRLAQKIILVPILRAGLGFVEGMTDLFPEASVGHLGMYRDETTLQPKHYYAKFPPIGPTSLALPPPWIWSKRQASPKPF